MVHLQLVVHGLVEELVAKQNTMDYVQIMTLGDAVDFGDLVIIL